MSDRKLTIGEKLSPGPGVRSLVITGARIVASAPSVATATETADARVADVVIVDGVVTDLTASEAPSDAQVIDADGLILLPGFVDLHTHLREPGREDAETICSGSRAAAVGGYTAILAMANTTPVTDTAEAAERILDLGRACGLVDVQPIGAVTHDLAGGQLAELGLMHRSRARVNVFSDDGRCVADARVMRRALEYIRSFGGVVSQHSQDPALAGPNACCHEGELSGRLGLPGWPAVAESVIIARDVQLARHTGSRVHVAHVSTAEGVDVIRWAKAQGIAVTAEVTPHHLALTTERLAGYDPVFKVNPPLRPIEDVQAVRAALADGTIDAVATDHAPHARHDKEHAFEDAAFGMLGLETALSVVASVMVEGGPCWVERPRPCHVERPRRHCRPGRPRTPDRAGGAGQLGARRPGGCHHRGPQQLAVAVPQQPLARRAVPGRRSHDHPARSRDRRRRSTCSMLSSREPAILILEDGRTFTGRAYGRVGTTVGEAVFSTGMTGYQETLTDPSYHRQVVVMTAPHVGNTGWNDEDDESSRIWVAGYVVRDPAVRPSNWRSRRSPGVRARPPRSRRDQ
jgi:dihydroorotase